MIARLALLASLLAPTVALADRSTVELSIDSCEDPSAILHMVQVELGDALVSAGGSVRASITCDGEIAILRVESMVEGHAMRGIDLRTSIPAARARLVALALAEMIQARPTTPAPRAAVPIAPPSAIEPRGSIAAPPASSRARLAVVAQAMRFSEDGDVFPGTGARLAIDARSHVAWMLDVHFDRGTESTFLGDVSTNLFGLGAAVQGFVRAGRARFEAAAGIRGGIARVTGTPMTWNVRGTSISRGWFGPMVRAGISVPLGRSVALEASTEVGRVMSPFIATTLDGFPIVTVDGHWLQLELGLAIRL